MITVTKRFVFDSAHKLPDYEGKCHRLHGHTYHLDVTVLGDVEKSGPNKGMVIDFSVLKDIVNRCVIDKYDHGYLNDFFENPTAEVMVNKIAEDIEFYLPKTCSLYSVKLWETETSYAEWNILYNTRD